MAPSDNVAPRRRERSHTSGDEARYGRPTSLLPATWGSENVRAIKAVPGFCTPAEEASDTDNVCSDVPTRRRADRFQACVHTPDFGAAAGRWRGPDKIRPNTSSSGTKWPPAAFRAFGGGLTFVGRQQREAYPGCILSMPPGRWRRVVRAVLPVPHAPSSRG